MRSLIFWENWYIYQFPCAPHVCDIACNMWAFAIFAPRKNSVLASSFSFRNVYNIKWANEKQKRATFCASLNFNCVFSPLSLFSFSQRKSTSLVCSLHVMMKITYTQQPAHADITLLQRWQQWAMFLRFGSSFISRCRCLFVVVFLLKRSRCLD